jgi:rod shape-determining protein MreC
VAIGGRTRSTRGLVILLVTASLVIITVDYREGSNGPLSRMSDGLHSVVIPLQNGVSKVFHPVAAFFGALVGLPSKQEKIDRLEARIEQLQAEHVESLNALAQLNTLQRTLDIAKSYQFQTEAADVVGNGVSNFDWTIEIDKGSSDGIKRDMPVMSWQGLVGRVIHVTPFGSQVLLLTHPDSDVATRLVESQETGLLQGQGRSDLVMSSIDQTAKVGVGEPVMTSGYSGGLFPPGIPVGTVSKVQHDPATGALQVSVAPDVDFSKLDVVLVITSFNGG